MSDNRYKGDNKHQRTKTGCTNKTKLKDEPIADHPAIILCNKDKIDLPEDKKPSVHTQYNSFHQTVHIIWGAMHQSTAYQLQGSQEQVNSLILKETENFKR